VLWELTDSLSVLDREELSAVFRHVYSVQTHFHNVTMKITIIE